MKSWEYDISFHLVEDESFPKEQIIACDTEGHCFFNDVMKPYLDFFKDLLNEGVLRDGSLCNLAIIKAPWFASGKEKRRFLHR